MTIKPFQAWALLTLLCACAPGPTQEVPDEFKKGQKQFHRVCSNCHGADAMGGHTKAPRLIDEEFLPPDFTDDDIRDTILNGSSSGKMPPQKTGVSEEEIGDIIKYLRYSQKAAGVEPADDEEDEDDEEA
ncbi:MAG: c-type cytochrome [Nitrospinaceae bacterium]